MVCFFLLRKVEKVEAMQISEQCTTVTNGNDVMCSPWSSGIKVKMC